jgi:origin recognition complex subunit 1
MDELDQLLTAKQDVVYNFFNWPTMRDSQLFVIATANRMDLPQHLAAKIQSRLGLQTLLFQPYDRAALIEIVQSRLVPHPASSADHKVLAPDAIALAATKMAGTNGDARRVLDACRRAVEVAMKSKQGVVGARDMAAVLNAMGSSPVALFIKAASPQQKMMLAAMVRCVRREGVPEIAWRALRADHDALIRALAEDTEVLSDAELALVRASLLASHALTVSPDLYKGGDERRVALGMEIGEVGRVLMNEGDAWRRALAGT